jgi:hypothetical protein
MVSYLLLMIHTIAINNSIGVRFFLMEIQLIDMTDIRFMIVGIGLWIDHISNNISCSSSLDLLHHPSYRSRFFSHRFVSSTSSLHYQDSCLKFRYFDIILIFIVYI